MGKRGRRWEERDKEGQGERRRKEGEQGGKDMHA